jgi:TatD DNase family protein
MDFHCHVDLYRNARAVYAEAQKRMEFVWLVTTSPRAFEATSKVLHTAENILVTPGLHPEVADRKAAELDQLLRQMAHITAVGEVGLDGSARYRAHFDLQRKIFSAIVERSQSLGGRVLSVHSRAAATDVLDILERFPRFGTAVLHWFTDAAPSLRRAVTVGCWFSVGPAMLSSANGRKLAALMPRDRVVAESDGPFAQVAGTALMPWQASGVATGLADIWGVPLTEVAETLSVNGRKLIEKIRPHTS